MARPTRVAAEDIEQAAVNLVRANGLSALTARGVADALGVSTQPVYSSWGSMDALRERVDERVRAFIQTYLAQPEPGAPPMLSLGLRTVRLAKEEPHLFDLAAAWMRRKSPALPHRRSSRRCGPTRVWPLCPSSGSLRSTPSCGSSPRAWPPWSVTAAR